MPSLRLLVPNPESGGVQPPPESRVDDATPNGSFRPRNVRSRRYLGSYSRTPSSLDVLRGSSQTRQMSNGLLFSRITPNASQAHLEQLLTESDTELDKFGVEELRDGFFDASFFARDTLKSARVDPQSARVLPRALQGHHPLSIRYFFPSQHKALIGVLRNVVFTRDGINLIKSFLALFLAYVVCLIPKSQNWLGRYDYILVLSVLVNHPGRTVGAQIDGAVWVVLGTAAGLGWGSLALWVSTSTGPARSGYGGVLAVFLILFTASIAWFRARFIRFYQAVLSGGIAICHTCLAETSRTVGWGKVFDYGIPWLLGQALGLIVCTIIFPDAGSRALIAAYSSAVDITAKMLKFPRPRNVEIRRDLAWNFVNLTEVTRDFRNEITISKLRPREVEELRNLLQAMLRARLAMKTDVALYEGLSSSEQRAGCQTVFDQSEPSSAADPKSSQKHTTNTYQIISQTVSQPTAELLGVIRESLRALKVELANSRGHRSDGSSPHVLEEMIKHMVGHMQAFDLADRSLLKSGSLPESVTECPEAVELILFVHPIRQLAESVHNCLVFMAKIKARGPKYAVHLPSYPLWKSFSAVNPQVRHDRGGLTAGFFFSSKRQIDTMMQKLQGTDFEPSVTNRIVGSGVKVHAFEESADGKYLEEEKAGKSAGKSAPTRSKARYRIWLVLHTLQGFETRFAFKVVLLTSALAIPAWLPSTSWLWSENESWWSVVMIWLMMHPRVGGNFHDLMTRAFCGVLGAVWGGFAFGSAHGNPYVMAVFFCVYMLPMLYRYSRSTHPRSGLVGCVSFIVISLSAKSNSKSQGTIHVAWTRGAAIVIGVVAAILLNWVLWPFVARHELRKSLSSMLHYQAVLYRMIVSKYIYYEVGERPGPKEAVWFQMLESRLREGFVRIRQLTELTRHEIRLRGPFDPLPFMALTDACERFYDKLVEVRQSSEYFHPNVLHGDAAATSVLLPHRRDAVATILMTLYVLAGGLREGRPIPRYLPSAAAARKRLLDRMSRIEEEFRHRDGEGLNKGNATTSIGQQRNERRWADVYQYAYSTALTDVVEQLQRLQDFTRDITGEVGFDDAMKEKEA